MIDFYDPRFLKISNTVLGEELWEMLNRPGVVERLKEASRYKRAAVDAVTEEIKDSFGKRLVKTGKLMQYKRMIGAMIRNVLENEGFVHVRSDVRCVRGMLFKRGSIYKESEKE